MITGTWENLYQTLQIPQMSPVMTGFNANIDRVIPVTPEILGSFDRLATQGFSALRDRLHESMRFCSADEVFISNPSEYQAFSKAFSRLGTMSVGGQAGIAAVHLRQLGVPSVMCVVPAAGTRTCALLKDAGVRPVTFGQNPESQADIIHQIFEYPPGMVPVADNVVPRSNRFIVSPLHDPSTVIIPDAVMDLVFEQVSACRRAFLSGYQYLLTEQEFVTAARQIRMIRAVHTQMRTHVECVSGVKQDVMAMMLHHIFPNTDSIGLNERELGLFMHVLRNTDTKTPVAESPSSPVACIHDAIALAEATGVSRVHLHTFGYYVLVLKSDLMNPVVSRNALLFAARVTANTAGGGEHILSRDGLLALTTAQKEFGPDETPGIFRYDNRIVILIPTRIVQHIQHTIGLGDLLSSTAFVADHF